MTTTYTYRPLLFPRRCAVVVVGPSCFDGERRALRAAVLAQLAVSRTPPGYNPAASHLLLIMGRVRREFTMPSPTELAWRSPVGAAGVRLLCLNHTKADEAEHHQEIAREHGLPPPGPSILYVEGIDGCAWLRCLVTCWEWADRSRVETYRSHWAYPRNIHPQFARRGCRGRS